MRTTPARNPTRAVATVASLASLALLTACGISSRSYNVSGAPGGDSAACAGLVAEAPHELAGHQRGKSGPKGTVVWGDGDVIVRCGNISDVPASAPCAAVNGVAWTVDENKTREGTKTVLSYGRTPAVEIATSERVTRRDEVVRDLSGIVARLPGRGACPDRH